jgi:hypothetical protein
VERNVGLGRGGGGALEVDRKVKGWGSKPSNKQRKKVIWLQTIANNFIFLFLSQF